MIKVWVLRCTNKDRCGTLDGHIFDEEQAAIRWMSQPTAKENYRLSEGKAVHKRCECGEHKCLLLIFGGK